MFAANLTGWLALVAYGNELPIALLMPLGGLMICLHGSLQHECIHGHPTPWSSVNRLIAFAPLGLWMPFDLYRDMHLAHHGSAKLTHPTLDTESFYVTQARWEQLGCMSRALLRFNTSLVGRMLIGPPLAVFEFWRGEIRLLASGDARRWRIWIVHALACAAVLGVVSALGMSPWLYVVAFVWPGISFTLQRSFAEHHPGLDNDHSIAIVEASPVLSLIYLNNNLHSLHHAEPAVSWYQLGRRYADNSTYWKEHNGNVVYRGYGELWRRFAMRMRSPVHPVTS
jgi:fatty acid desaturase